MELPDEMTTGAAGGCLALLATMTAIWRHQIRAFFTIFLDVLLRRTTEDDRPTLFDYKTALERERDNRKSDIDALRILLDSITARVNALEQTVTTWKTESLTSTAELQALQVEVQRIASRIGVDMSGLRDLLLEVLKRTR